MDLQAQPGLTARQALWALQVPQVARDQQAVPVLRDPSDQLDLPVPLEIRVPRAPRVHRVPTVPLARRDLTDPLAPRAQQVPMALRALLEQRVPRAQPALQVQPE